MTDTCIHPKLQLYLVVPEECLVRGDIGAWYQCERCGEKFNSDIKPYFLKVKYGTVTTNRDLPEDRCGGDGTYPSVEENKMSYHIKTVDDLLKDKLAARLRDMDAQGITNPESKAEILLRLIKDENWAPWTGIGGALERYPARG